MTLTAEQKREVAGWVTAGENLSTIQKKLSEQFKLTLTYMDVRFLVDDLDLTLKDPAPSPNAEQSDLSKPPAPDQTPRPADEDLDDDPLSEQNQLTESADDYPDEAVPPQPGQDAATNVRIEVDNVTLMPGAIVSGSVTFTDGVTGKWIVDQQGRPGFTQISQPGYRPAPADAQAFMRELSAALQKKGF